MISVCLCRFLRVSPAGSHTASTLSANKPCILVMGRLYMYYNDDVHREHALETLVADKPLCVQ